MTSGTDARTNLVEKISGLDSKTYHKQILRILQNFNCHITENSKEGYSFVDLSKLSDHQINTLTDSVDLCYQNQKYMDNYTELLQKTKNDVEKNYTNKVNRKFEELKTSEAKENKNNKNKNKTKNKNKNKNKKIE